jgi:microcystin-dependent protein
VLKNPHSRTKNVKSIYNFSIICKPASNVFGAAFFEKAAFLILFINKMALSPKAVILIFLGIIGIGVLCYFLIQTRERNNGDGGGGNSGKPIRCPESCLNTCDKDGKCPPPVSPCGPKPTDTADCTYICDEKLTTGGWRCLTACDENDNTTDYSMCGSVSNLGCNSNNQFFCKNSDKCSSHGQYIPQNKTCVCNEGYGGKTCNCTAIPNCAQYNDSLCTCTTCSSNSYYGDNCTPCPENQIFDGKNCVCINGYKKDANGKCVLTGDCANGGKLVNGKCVCSVEDGVQYYGDKCQRVAKCAKKEQFTWSGKPDEDATCDCSKDTSKVMCGATCTNDPNPSTCKNGGTPTCQGCACPKDYTGSQCQCAADKPNVDPCKGEKSVCGDDGWTTHTVTTCSDLYSLNGGSEELWMTNCLAKNCNDPKNLDLNHSMTCGVDDKTHGISINCQQVCPKTPPPTKCPKDPNDPSKNFVLQCDSTTGYQYGCKQQQYSSGCNASDGFCPDNIGGPRCVTCGNTQLKELICSGNSPSRECVNAAYENRISQKADNSHTYWTLDSIPIYPTIDNVLCNKGAKSTEILYQGEYNGYTAFNSENGYLENGKFTPVNDPLVKHTYASSPDAKYDDNINCWWKDDDIVSYLGGKQGDKICSGRGEFKQDQNENPNYFLKSGKCECSLYDDVNKISKKYVGGNCQYDDNTTCNGVGTALENGSCLPMNLIVAFDRDFDTDAPSGWAECDGTQGTPDITGRFIMGGGLDSFRGGAPALYSTGGEATHPLALNEMPDHTHNFVTTKYTIPVHNYTNYVSCITQEPKNPPTPTTQLFTDEGTYTQQNIPLMPPYKVVVFAMRKSNLSSDTLPVGSIIWYYSTTSTPPSGWTIYDTTKKFLLGRKKGVYTLGTTGGAAEITLAENNLPPHQHSYNYPYADCNTNTCSNGVQVSCSDCGVNQYKKTGNTSEAGQTNPTSVPIIPPYQSLLCIKKTDKATNDIPVGAICAWANHDGKTLPSGWVICDTTNNSPDLRDKFVYADNNVTTGGSSSITLTESHLPRHSHVSTYYQYPPNTNHCDRFGDFVPGDSHNVSDCSSETETINSTSGAGIYMKDKSLFVSVSQTPLQTIPPYIVLLYIMKVF